MLTVVAPFALKGRRLALLPEAPGAEMAYPLTLGLPSPILEYSPLVKYSFLSLRLSELATEGPLECSLPHCTVGNTDTRRPTSDSPTFNGMVS